MKDFRINQEIRAKKVMTIDPEGNSLGLLDIHQALDMARDLELDLVEVSPNLSPSVCKIMDYGKHRYKVAKQGRQHSAKQKKVEVKEIRISVRTEEHDMNFKAKNAIKFMQKGHKVKMELVLKGREKANQDFARQKFEMFIGYIYDIVKNDPKTVEKEIVKIQDTEKSPRGYSAMIEFKRN